MTEPVDPASGTPASKRARQLGSWRVLVHTDDGRFMCTFRCGVRAFDEMTAAYGAGLMMAGSSFAKELAVKIEAKLMMDAPSIKPGPDRIALVGRMPADLISQWRREESAGARSSSADPPETPAPVSDHGAGWTRA